MDERLPDGDAPARLPLVSLSHPVGAALAALAMYLAQSGIGREGFGPTPHNLFNYLADGFLHGQLHLRQSPPSDLDVVYFQGRAYLYWPPFPAILVMPLVALFGVGVSDALYTVACGAFSIGLLSKLLNIANGVGLAPLSVARREILVASTAFGSFLLILVPSAGVWYTAQVIGWTCVLLATVAALSGRGRGAYAMTGLWLACATGTRIPLLFNGVWLAFYMLRRDMQRPLRQQLACMVCGLAPIVIALAALGGYNWARFGHPLETGLSWHNAGESFQANFAKYGAFNLRYLPTNLYYQFITHPFLGQERWMGGGLFWMTPLLLGSLFTVWRNRRDLLVWSLVLSCILVYVPIGLLMGTGYRTFGPRYLLDLMVPLLVLTAMGIRRWPLSLLVVLLTAGCITYGVGAWQWWFEG